MDLRLGRYGFLVAPASPCWVRSINRSRLDRPCYHSVHWAYIEVRFPNQRGVVLVGLHRCLHPVLFCSRSVAEQRAENRIKFFPLSILLVGGGAPVVQIRLACPGLGHPSARPSLDQARLCCGRSMRLTRQDPKRTTFLHAPGTEHRKRNTNKPLPLMQIACTMQTSCISG